MQKSKHLYRNADARCKLLISNYELNLENEVPRSDDIGSFYKHVNKRTYLKQG